MGLGFVIFFWLLFFVTVLIIFSILWLLAKKYCYAKVLQNVFKKVVLVVFTLMLIGTTYGVIDFSLQKFFPSLIFSRYLGFSPTDDVKELQGSVKIFGEGGLGEIFLKFKADKETVEKIIDKKMFVEKFKSSYQNTNDLTVRNFAKMPEAKIYISNDSTNCNAEQNCTAILAYNELNKDVYFVW